MKTDTEVRMCGLNALVEALGEVDAERFVTLLLREPFDYTKWQASLWPGRTVRQLSADAMSYRKTTTNP